MCLHALHAEVAPTSHVLRTRRTLALENDVQRYSASVILSGATSSAAIITSMSPSSFGAQMRQFNQPEGICIQVPDRKTGLREQRFRAWCIQLLADYPAAAKLLPTMGGATALLPDRLSNYDTRRMLQGPSSYLRKGPGINNHWIPRTQESMTSALSEAAAVPKGAQQEFLRNLGYNSLTYAMQPSLIPHFRIEMAAQDGMHGEPDGLLRMEAYQMLFMIIRVEEWASFDEVNAMISQYHWPKGHKPPPLHSSVQKGATGKVPSTDTVLRYTASETLHFAKHSVFLLRRIIKDSSRPFWQSWLAHVEYLELLMQLQITPAQVTALDAAVYKHQELFIKAYGTRLWKPKHAFAQMYALDILRSGPMRVRWCMRLEAFNQIIKRLADGSVFKNICLRVMHLWSLKCARDLKLGRTSDWGSTQVVYLSEAPRHVSAASTSDPLYIRFFGINCSSDATLQISELTSMHHLGDVYTAGESWVIHQSFDVEALHTPALARVDRMLEVQGLSHSDDALIWIQITRFPDMVLNREVGNVASIPEDMLLEADTQDELLLLDWQAVTPLHLNVDAETDLHSFIFLR